MNYIVSEEQAELTDEFVSQISDCQTVDEYRQMVREALETSREMSGSRTEETLCGTKFWRMPRWWPIIPGKSRKLLTSTQAMISPQLGILKCPWKIMFRLIRA